MRLSKLKAVVGSMALLMATIPFLTGANAAEASTTYTFDACEQGWTTTVGGALPGFGAWARTEPGHGGEGFAFSTGEYSELQTLSLTSPAHEWAGGPVTVSLFVAYDVEPEDSTAYYDHLSFQWSVDGGGFTEEKVWYGTNDGFPEYVEDSVTFEAPAGELTVRFRLISDELYASSIGGWTGVWVDDVTIPAAKPESALCEGEEPGEDPGPDPGPNPDPGPECTITGTDGDDNLQGTADDDVICGLGGNDLILGLGGNDLLIGGGGSDELLAGSGDDVLKGSKGADELNGGSGDDKLRGGRGHDDLDGGSDDDLCRGGKGRNQRSNCER